MNLAPTVQPADDEVRPPSGSPPGPVDTADSDAAAVVDGSGCERHMPYIPVEDPLSPEQMAAAAEVAALASVDYPYRDGSGEVVAIRRRIGKRLSWVGPAAADSARPGRPSGVPWLPYRLPELLAAVEAEVPVYVAEGELSSDALAAVGVFATTLGDKKCPLTPSALEPFRGAHAMIVADRDEPGRARAAAVARGLADIARCVQIVEAAEGNGVVDHLAAGMGPLSFRPVDPADLPPAPVRRPAGRSAATAWPAREDLEVIRPQFRAEPEEMVQTVTRTRNGVESTQDRQVLSARARLVAYVERDTGDSVESRVTHYLVEVARGEETYEVEVDRKEWLELIWVDEANRCMGWDVNFNRTPSGRAIVIQAVVETSGKAENRIEQGRPGWVAHPSTEGTAGWAWCDGEGAIGESGRVPMVTHLDQSAAGVRLGEPAVTRDDRRAAVAASLALLQTGGGLRPWDVFVPLLGAGYRALIGKVSTTIYLRGTMRSGKTGAAAFAMQHYAPGVRHGLMPIQAGAESSTLTALETTMHAAGGSLFVIDDINADSGQLPAQQRAALLARQWFAGQGKARGRREGGNRRTKDYTGALVITGEEVPAVASAESRLTYIPMGPGDVDVEALRLADTGDGPALRARWTATLAQWLAPRLAAERADLAAREVELSREFREAVPGLNTRTADMVAQLAGGWHLMLRAAIDLEALSESTAHAVWEEVWAALVRTAEGQTAALEDRSAVARVAAALTTALASGQAHVDTVAGEMPVAATRWGWVRDRSVEGPAASSYEVLSRRPGGPLIGWVDETEGYLYLMSGAARAAVEAQTRTEGEPLGMSTRAIAAALSDAREVTGLAVERNGHQEHYAPVFRSPAGPQRCWRVDRRWLEGSDDPPPSNPAPRSAPDSGPTAPVIDPEPAGQGGDGSSNEGGLFDGPSAIDDEDQVDDEVAALGQHEAERREMDEEGADMDGEAARELERPEMSEGEEAPPPSVTIGLVVDPDESWWTRLDGPASPAEVLPASAWRSLSALLDTVAAMVGLDPQRRRGDVEVWLSAAAAERVGFPTEEPKAAPAARKTDRSWTDSSSVLAAAREAGWNVHGNGPWLTAYRQGGRTLHVSLVGWVDPVEHRIVAGADGPRGLADRLSRWAGQVQSKGTPVPYRRKPGAAGLDLLRLTRNGRDGGQRQTEAVTPPPVIDQVQVNPYLWRRRPGPGERPVYVHGYDRNAEYLGAARTVELGMGEASHASDPLPFDPKVAGLWLVDPGRAEFASLPDPAGPESVTGPRWMTTPGVAYLVERGYEVNPAEAWLWAERSRYLDKWAETFTTARRNLSAGLPTPDSLAVLAAVKAAYAETVGRLAASYSGDGSDPLFRPDWRAFVMDAARVNLHRAIVKVGEADNRFPLLVYRDLVVYGSDDPDPVSSAPPHLVLSGQVGKFKPQLAAPAGPVLELLEHGSGVVEIVEAIRRGSESR